jgi:hypothetical protein
MKPSEPGLLDRLKALEWRVSALEAAKTAPEPPKRSTEAWRPVPSAFQRAVQAAAKAFDVTDTEVWGKSKVGPAVAARHAAWKLISDVGYKQAEIRDAWHRGSGTVFHGLKSATGRIETDRRFRQGWERATLFWKAAAEGEQNG